MNSVQWKYVAALLKSVCVAALLLIVMPGRAESIVPADQSVESVRAASGQAVTPAAAFDSGLWRTLHVSRGATRYEYREPDPLGRVNPLNSETGSVPTTELTLRWRGQLAQALPELTMQARASSAQGQTDYNGYLQQGITLAPYSARTGNTMQALRLRMGLPLNAFTGQPWAQHIVPYAEQGWHHWQRNLVQYGETFTWQTTSIGVMVLWPLADLGLQQFSRLTLEADLTTGRIRSPHMVAPTLGFAADLDSAGTNSATLALHYKVTSSWLLGLRYEAQRMNFGTSLTVVGLQYPGSGNNEQSLAVSLAYHY
jgi:hypothetical protein